MTKISDSSYFLGHHLAYFSATPVICGTKTSRQQITMNTQTATTTTTFNIDRTDGTTSPVSLQSQYSDFDIVLTSDLLNFHFSTLLHRCRKPHGTISPDVVWSIPEQTAAEAVTSLSQTFPTGTSAGLIVLLIPAL